MMLSDQDRPPSSWETVGKLTCSSLPQHIVAEITCYCKGDDCNIHNRNSGFGKQDSEPKKQPQPPIKPQPQPQPPIKPQPTPIVEDNGSDDDNGSDGASNIQLGLGLVVAMVLIREI